jgi:predicted Zn-dependent protease
MMIRKTLRLAACLLFLPLVAPVFAQTAAGGNEDPVIRAMKTEMQRSKSRLKLAGMPVPYYIDYHIADMDRYEADATLGALRTDLHTHMRMLRVVVRVGDYKQDSYFAMGEGASGPIPLEDDDLALRTALWLATDQAYKNATEALTAKQAQLKQFTNDQPVDDFAHAEPVQYLGPLAKLDFDAESWLGVLRAASALARRDSQIQASDASLDFQAVNRYFVNSEGAIIRTGQTMYELTASGSTQAADGMHLQRSNGYQVSSRNDLPSRDVFLAFTRKLLDTLASLRQAPVVDEEYRGPVLMSGDAAASIFGDLIGGNALGIKPGLGNPARTQGAFSGSYKSRVLPDFLSVVDDPTLTAYGGKSLVGHYDVDDEGVKALRVPIVVKGTLVNYLLGRAPIRDFPVSNGHGRARLPSLSPGPGLSNLLITTSAPLSAAELKQKLIDLCRERGLEYGYYAETLAQAHAPRLLYRIWVKDGHEELVRGAIFGDLDTRALRSDVTAAGGEMYVDNHLQGVPHSVVSPAILFEELEVKRANANKEKLPEYPPPALTAGR